MEKLQITNLIGMIKKSKSLPWQKGLQSFLSRRLFWPVWFFWFFILYDAAFGNTTLRGPKIFFPQWLLNITDVDGAPRYFRGIAEPVCAWLIVLSFFVVIGMMIYSLAQKQYFLASGYILHIGLIFFLSNEVYWKLSFIPYLVGGP